MNKLAKYTLGTALIALAGYNAVYVKKLSDVKKSGTDFDAVAYAERLFNEINTDTAKIISLDQLLQAIEQDKTNAFAKHGHALALGNTRYFLVCGTGIVKDTAETGVELQTEENNRLTIVTAFVYGNAVRDASGRVQLSDFNNTADLNAISADLDKIIRQSVIPPFRKSVHPGDTVDFLGAVELNQEHLNLDAIEVIPIRLTIKNNPR